MKPKLKYFSYNSISNPWEEILEICLHGHVFVKCTQDILTTNVKTTVFFHSDLPQTHILSSKVVATDILGDLVKGSCAGNTFSLLSGVYFRGSQLFQCMVIFLQAIMQQ